MVKILSIITIVIERPKEQPVCIVSYFGFELQEICVQCLKCQLRHTCGPGGVVQIGIHSKFKGGLRLQKSGWEPVKWVELCMHQLLI